MQIDEKKALEELVSRGIKIPPQPSVLVELNQLLMSGDYDARVLARVIAKDPGITSMLFKAACSPVFGSGRHFKSLDKVLMVIGIQETFNLVRAMALTSSISDNTRKAFEVFWTRSQEVAQLAALIAADRVSVCNIFPDQAYLAGIFHECGVPLLMQRFPDYCETMNLRSTCCGPELAEEDARFNVDHSVVGYLVARHWKLPGFVCGAIRYHHELPPDEVGAVTTLLAILQLAIHFYHQLLRTKDPSWAWLSEPVMAELGLSFENDQDYFELIAERFHSS
ncbi:MAG: HDOD domain-containing protein [Sterolibacterium sp.]|nr:HDOD domain-containing protein [Sterolibacterium sp.]